MSTQYPGPDPDDPFAKEPQEGATNAPGQPPTPPPPPPAGPPPVTDETAPIQREEVGYWEKLAQEQAGQNPPPPPAAPTYQQNPTTAQPADQNPWAGYGEPALGTTPPPPPAPSPYGAPPPVAYGTPPAPYAYGAGYAATPVQNHPQSTTALVLGLIGLVGGCLCGLPLLVSPFAWVIGGRARKEIAASNGQLGGQGNAQAGFVMGIIGTVLLVLGLLLIGLFVVLGLSGSLDSSSTYSSTDF